MKKRSKLALCAAAALAAAAGAASASPLRLDYCVQDQGGGVFRYTFSLVLDNHDGSWQAGQGFGWVIFGDEPGPPQGSGMSPINDFQMDPASFPIGPFTSLSGSGGGHNGPTLGPVVVEDPPGSGNYVPNLWRPAAIGDSLTWSGTASEDLAQGQLKWSNLMADNGANYAAWDPGIRETTCGTPLVGACCTFDGSCTVTADALCTGAGGVYHGTGTNCSGVSCPPPAIWHESGDAGDSLATAQTVTGNGALQGISGTMGDITDADIYKIQICDAANFRATTVGGTGLDTKLFLFDSTGHGITSNDDDGNGGAPASTITGQFVPASGQYYLAVSTYANDPHGATTGGLIWEDAPYTDERRPDGPAASEALGSWDGAGSGSGSYTVRLNGACYISSGPSCYANCDSSTAVPFLNVNDFICFQGRFAAGDSYANCDGSTQPPVLNVNDFICFQGRFAAGCSAP